MPQKRLTWRLGSQRYLHFSARRQKCLWLSFEWQCKTICECLLSVHMIDWVLYRSWHLSQQ